MRVGVLTDQVPFVQGGAEQHAANLVDALRAHGCEAEILSMPFRWFPPGVIAPQILAARLLDVTQSSGRAIDRVIGLKFPAYLMPHPDKVLWILHQHRSAYDLWEQPFGDLHGHMDGERAMRAIREADTRLIPEARRVFTNSRRVSERLRRFNDIDGTPLYHPPPLADRFTTAEPEDFLLMPSRINAIKRQMLVADALALVRSDVRVWMVGRPDNDGLLRELEARAASLPAGRLRLVGGVDDDEKLALYARCRAVLYVPFDEDYGYVTLEAMLAGKALVTTSDSGGVLEFADDGETALIAEPTPASLAERLDRIWTDAALARRLGRAGAALYRERDISWSGVVERLLA